MNIKKSTLLFLVTVSFFTLPLFALKKRVQTQTTQSQCVYSSFDNWAEACAKLPFYHKQPQTYSYKPEELTQAEIEKVIGDYKKVMQKTLTNKNKWVGHNPPHEAFFTNPTFKPFAQKLALPEDSKIFFHGDLHGDIHSLLTYLKTLQHDKILANNFKIIPENAYLVFLGDYTDRGNYGIEVIYTLLRLKIANPEKVILVRGNHEDFDLNAALGFAQEVQIKFNQETNDFLKNRIAQIYDFMPVVVYLGTNTDFLQCNHGGMELGYLPHALLNQPQTTSYEWIEHLDRQANWHNHIKKQIQTPNNLSTSEKQALAGLTAQNIIADTPQKIGFLWNDFCVNPGQYLYFNPHRGYEFGKKLTHDLLKAASKGTKKVVGVFRAHQHSTSGSAMMNLILNGATPGVGKLWDTQSPTNATLWPGIVATFNVSPDSVYGVNLKFNYDTYGILKLDKNFPQDWDLAVKIIAVFEQ